MPTLTLYLAGFALLASLVALGLAWTAWRSVVEPLELRKQLLAFDEALTEHEQRAQAFYARQRKRDKTLTATLTDAALQETAEQPIVEPPRGTPEYKQMLRQRAALVS